MRLHPSLTSLGDDAAPTTVINTQTLSVRVRALVVFICRCIHQSAAGVPNQSLVRGDLCCNASNQQTFTVKYDFINTSDQ